MLKTSLKRFARVCGHEKMDQLIASFDKDDPDDEPVPYTHILDLCGFDLALLAIRAEPAYDIHWRAFAIWCAKRVQKLIKEERPLAAIDAAEKFLAAGSYGSQKLLEAAHIDALAFVRDVNRALARRVTIPGSSAKERDAMAAAAHAANPDAVEAVSWAAFFAAKASPRGFLEERVRQCARFRKICATEN
jgi:hypothetical protein